MSLRTAAAGVSGRRPEYVLGADDERWLRETLPDAVRKKFGLGARAEAQKGRSHKKGAGKAVLAEQQKAQEERRKREEAEQRAALAAQPLGEARRAKKTVLVQVLMRVRIYAPSVHWPAANDTTKTRRGDGVVGADYSPRGLYTFLRHQHATIAPATRSELDLSLSTRPPTSDRVRRVRERTGHGGRRGHSGHRRERPASTTTR